VRPFGLCTLIVGFNAADASQPGSEPAPVIYLTEPSGVHSEWKANAIGRGGKPVREFLEKAFTDALSRDETVKLTVRALLEVVQTGAAMIEIAVMTADGVVQHLTVDDVQRVIEVVEREKAEEAEKRRTTTSA